MRSKGMAPSVVECYVRAWNFRGARTAWKKSLELNPAQAGLEKMAELQGKIKESS